MLVNDLGAQSGTRMLPKEAAGPRARGGEVAPYCTRLALPWPPYEGPAVSARRTFQRGDYAIQRALFTHVGAAEVAASGSLTSSIASDQRHLASRRTSPSCDSPGIPRG